MFINLIRWWLVGILLLLPFHHMIIKIIKLWSKELSTFINKLDEITIVIFLLFAIREFYKNREILNRLYLILLFPIIIFSIFGLLSGVVNGNSLLITIHGVFDYIKNFLVIFIYAAFLRKSGDFKKIFRLLLIVAVFLGVVALIQELWALSTRYILEKDIDDRGVYILRYIPLGSQTFKNYWRFGIYRAPSLMPHPNSLGIYSLLILTIYLSIVKKVNPLIFISLLTGIFVSISRQVYTGFMFVAGLQIFRGRRWFILLMIIPVVMLMFSMSSLSEFDMAKGEKKRGFVTFSEYTRHKAIEIWKDNPFWGVGPGMFGGPISVKYQSPFYEEYNFSATKKNTLGRWHDIDQFWPQVLAETGTVGTVVFAGLLISLIILFLILRQRVNSDEMRGLFSGLATLPIIIIIYAFASSLNNPSFLFTYSALAGIGLGCGSVFHKKIL